MMSSCCVCFYVQIRYKQRSVWSTPDTQMTMCWQPTHNLLYSGSVGGRVHAWDVETQQQKCCLEGHTDIVMQVLSIDCLDSIVSGSLDRTINIWDSYTEQQTSKNEKQLSLDIGMI
jgi:WD40 repeat protein